MKRILFLLGCILLITGISSNISVASGTDGTSGDPEIPDYYFENNYLDQKIASIPEGKSFVFITDTHWPVNDKKSAQLISYVRKKTGISKVIFGGDILTRDENKKKAKETLDQYLQESINLFGTDYLPVFGNHDLNMANAKGDLDAMRLDWQDVEESFVSHLNGTAVFGNTEHTAKDSKDSAELESYNRLHYYCDDADSNIRYIIINTGTPENVVTARNYGVQNLSEMYLQMDWLYEVLMSTPDGFDVVVIGHEMNYNPKEKAILGYHMKGIIGQLSALKMRRSTSLYVSGSENELLDQWITRGNHVYDFSNAPDLNRVICVSGHNHWDYFLNCYYTSEDSIDSDHYTAARIENNTTIHQSKGEVPVIHTQCDARGAVDSAGCFEMTAGTVSEQCFDVITITDTGVVCTRFGAGEDRGIQFD